MYYKQSIIVPRSKNHSYPLNADPANLVRSFSHSIFSIVFFLSLLNFNIQIPYLPKLFTNAYYQMCWSHGCGRNTTVAPIHIYSELPTCEVRGLHFTQDALLTHDLLRADELTWSDQKNKFDHQSKFLVPDFALLTKHLKRTLQQARKPLVNQPVYFAFLECNRTTRNHQPTPIQEK